MKKLILAAATILLFTITACKNDSDISDNGHSFLPPPPFERYELKTGPEVNAIFTELGCKTNNVTKIKASTQPPASSIPQDKIKYIDGREQDVLCWLDENVKTIYYYADGVTTAGGTQKLKLSQNSSYLFYYCTYVTEIDMDAFDSSNVTNMSYMFSRCEKLTSIDVSTLDTSNVTNMQFMFGFCESLTTIDFSTFNTSSVTDMSYMFASCSELTSLNLSYFNTSEVTTMGHMFTGCEKLASLNLSNFNTIEITNMGHMFFGCSKLTSLDLSSFNTSDCRSMTEMFYNCTSLTTITVSDSFVTTKATTSSSNMFASSTKLVGGNGTTYNADHVNYEYARIDVAGTPGYFTRKTNP